MRTHCGDHASNRCVQQSKQPTQPRTAAAAAAATAKTATTTATAEEGATEPSVHDLRAADAVGAIAVAD